MPKFLVFGWISAKKKIFFSRLGILDHFGLFKAKFLDFLPCRKTKLKKNSKFEALFSSKRVKMIPNPYWKKIYIFGWISTKNIFLVDIAPKIPLWLNDDWNTQLDKLRPHISDEERKNRPKVVLYTMYKYVCIIQIFMWILIFDFLHKTFLFCSIWVAAKRSYL